MLLSIPRKRCNACKSELPLTSEFWHKDKRIADGFARACKACVKIRTKQWYDENSERSKTSVKQWRLDNPDEYRANNLKSSQKRRELTGEALAEHKRKDAEYRKRTNARRVEYNHQYRAEHPEWVKEVGRTGYRRNAEKRKAASRIRVKAWKLKNPEKVRNQLHLRRARLRGNGGDGYTKEDKALQLRSQKGLCWWCSKPMGTDITEDHVISIKLGGQHTPRNIVLAHRSCNCSKKDKLPQDWIGRLF